MGEGGIEKKITVFNFMRYFNPFWLQVLADFPHATSIIPLDYLFDLIPPLKPRAFSIASSLDVSM